jgi:hypothetical protein
MLYVLLSFGAQKFPALVELFVSMSFYNNIVPSRHANNMHHNPLNVRSLSSHGKLLLYAFTHYMKTKNIFTNLVSMILASTYMLHL